MRILFFIGFLVLPVFQSILLGQRRLEKEEQTSAINTLALYQHVDSIFADKAEKLSDAIGKMQGEYDSTFYCKNIQHIDSVIQSCMRLVYQNNPKELLALLEKERLNFYVHPANTLTNEDKLHMLFAQLYNKFRTESNQDEYTSKFIALIEHTRLHIQLLLLLQAEIDVNYYFEISISLIEMYSSLNNYDKAIHVAKELCERSKNLDEKFYIYMVLMLEDLYRTLDMKIQQDSCINLVKDSPYFEEIYKEVNKN